MGLLASCAKEMEMESVIPATSQKTVLQVGIDPATKTYMGALEDGKHKVYWSNGDQIQINDKTSEALAGLEGDNQRAAFTFDEAPSLPYNVLYPASAWKTASQITLPDVQDWKDGNFADNMVPMAGYSEDGTAITVGYLCAIVKVSVLRATGEDADTDALASVRFSGKNNEQVKGLFNINYATGVLTGASDAAADKVVRVVKSQETATDAAAVYYITVPAITYANGFNLIIQDASGHCMTKGKASGVTLQAGKIYNLAEFTFVPDGTVPATDVEINTVDDLVAFATDYNNKVYEKYGASLTVKVMQNLAFDATSSAAFNATEGIGTKNGINSGTVDYYFSGTFDGNNKTISGLTATAPLFCAVEEDGVVKDLTLDNTCSYVFTHPGNGQHFFGSVVGYHKGTMSNVSSSADVTLAEAEVDKAAYIGGLVGRETVGTMDNCSYTGNITVPDTFSVDGNKVYVGGLLGASTNVGSVKNSDFDGTIDFAGIVASTDKNNPYLFIGGIIGSNVGTVNNCNTLGTETKEITMDNDKSYTATILNHSRKAYHLAQGGIAGYNAGTVSNCTNSASTQNFILSNAKKDGTASDSNSRYYDLGGIVGLNESGATVSGCINDAAIVSRSTPRIQKIGGVVGYSLGTVSSCSNTDNGSIYLTTTNISPYSVRVGEVGGVIGNNGGSVSEVSNAADISIDRTENAAGVELKFGGVIGLSTTAIDGGSGKNITNEGNILDSYNGATVTTAGLRYGGVVGSAQASVKNVTNSGSITKKLSAATVMSFLYMGGIVGELRSATSAEVSGCVNEGEVNFNVNGKNVAHTDNYVGGILGKTFESDVTISDCTNSGYIHGGNGSKQNGKTMFVGGIVAYLDGASSITGCTNNGKLLNDQFNNTVSKVGSTFEGGIAGFVVGTADDRISISNVINNYNNGATITGGRRGYTGGAVGYGEYVDISNASNANSYGGGSGYYIGGIAGWLVNSTVSGSTYSGTSIESTQVQGAGGIVCTLDAGTVIDGCYSYLSSITHGANACVDGDIAAKSVAGSTIKNCHYTDTYGICSDTNYTDGGGNVADL